MNWLFPGFLAGAAMIGLPVLLHFLRARPKTTVRFPSLRFLGASALRDTRRHRLRRWLTLALRCLIVALLAGAFARPFFVSADAARRRAVVVAIDNSMSMQARGRWVEARDRALAQLAALEPGDEAALLLMNPVPSWLSPMTGDLARVRATLRDAQPGYEKTRYAPALRAAGEMLAATPAARKTLVWLADEQRAGWLGVDLTPTLPPGVELLLGETAAAPERQAAIVALRAGAGAAAGVTATVRLFSPARDQRQLTVQAGGRVLAAQTIVLDAGDNAVSIPVAWPPEADGLRVSLDPDDLPADDSAWIAAPKHARADHVLLDRLPETDFVAAALRATGQLEDGGVAPAPLPEAAWPVASVVVARRAATFAGPRAAALDRFAAEGGPLWIFVDGSPEQSAWLRKNGIIVTPRAPAAEPAHLRDWDPEHPVLAAFAGQSLLPLLDVAFFQGFNLAGDALSPLADWPDGAVALAECGGNGRRWLIAGFPLDRAATDWPTRPSFVPFVHQAVRWLGSFAGAHRDWRVGDAIPLPGPGTWRALDAARSPGPPRAVAGSVRPEAPGLYEFTAGAAREVFAVNTPPEESDLTPWPEPEKLAALENRAVPASAAVPAGPPEFAFSAEAAENRQRYWWWALAACGAALLAELALANRTST